MYPSTDDFFNERFERVLGTFSQSPLHPFGSEHWLKVPDGGIVFGNQREWV